MIERGQHLRLTMKSRQAFRIGRKEFRQDLQRDVATEPRITCAIHLAHSAGADGGEDLVRFEACTGTEAHV